MGKAAVGLLYLQQKHKLVHGDLKCNNILVGTDDKAKIADFGLSFVFDAQDSEEIPAEEVGAICWKASEVIAHQTRGTFASEVYSSGICILEAAMEEKSLWGVVPDVTIKRLVVEEKKLPKRPEGMSDTQWHLIEKICAHDPHD